MKWSGQHIYDLVSRFRDDVYLEDLSTSSETTALVVDSDGKITTNSSLGGSGDITSVIAGTGLSGGATSGAATLNVDAAQTQITSIGTISTGVWRGTAIQSAYLDADTAHLTTDQTFSGAKTFSAATTTFTSATADSPIIKVLNTTDDDQAGQLIFEKLRDDDAVAQGQNLGEIWFKGQDDAQNTQNYAYIIGEIDVSTGGQESGRLAFSVANHDGGFGGAGLVLTGGSEDVEVDVTVGLGANSVVTIPGGLSLGTDLPTDQQKHLAWFTVKGFSTGNGTNYEVPTVLDDDDAPWKHSVSTGSAGTTAIAVNVIARMGGIIAPRAGTLKRWTGWATCGGSSTANIALFKITPTRNNNSDVAPVLLDNMAFTALGNTKMEDFDETSFTDADIAAGDIIVSGILCQNNKTTYFGSTLEIEWD
jgi:hypothetical protein